MTVMPTIVIAEKERGELSACFAKIDPQFPCSFVYVHTDHDLKSVLTANDTGILVIDLNFPKENEGIALISSIIATSPKLPIIPIIPYGQPQLVKQLFPLDLYYFIHAPIDPHEAQIALKRALQQSKPAKKQQLPPENLNHFSFHSMIGGTQVMRQLFEMIKRVADDDLSTVLIRGESGTGKEMVAKAIHAESRRRDKNFVPVNCAAIPDDLLESELFGYTKGAFTGATANKIGRIQYADQGTLFLDEIGDMKASLQAKLLRVIQEREFEPVGAFKSIPVNTRILAATHCDLEKLVSEGRFREDLYYRLSVIPLQIPSLRDRSSDIPLLIETFLDKYTNQRGRERFTFSPEALLAITHFEWRGNVRELENLIQHMSILFSGRVVERGDLPEKLQSVVIPAEAIPEKTPLLQKNTPAEADHSTVFQAVTWTDGQIDFNGLINDFETQLIVQAMKITEGNKKEAARLLKLKRTTLLEKIKKKDIEGLWDKE